MSNEHKRITLGDLDLPEKDMKTFAKGSAFLFGDGDQKDEPEEKQSPKKKKPLEE